jgi:hypothetical protein
LNGIFVLLKQQWKQKKKRNRRKEERNMGKGLGFWSRVAWEHSNFNIPLGY